MADPAEHLGRELHRERHALAAAFWAYLRLNTKRLAEVSEAADILQRAKVSALLLAISVVLAVLGAWAFGLPHAYEPWVVARLVLLVTLASVAIAVPLFIAYLLVRPPRMFFLLNILLIHQALAVVIVAISMLVLMSKEPARTDFLFLRDGVGQPTVAYEYFCGSLEHSAEIASMTRFQALSSGAVLHDIRLVRSWGQPTLAKFIEHEGEFRAQLQRREAEAAQTEKGLARQLVLFQLYEDSPQRFAERYPTYRIATVVLFASLGLLSLVSTYHIWIGATANAKGWRAKGVITAALVVAWICGGIEIELARRSTQYSTPGEIHFPAAVAHGMSEEQEIAALERASAELSAEAANSENELRSLFRSRKLICPNAKNYGLW